MAKTSKKVDPRDIFKYAESFKEAAELLNQKQVRSKPSGVKYAPPDAAHVSPMLTLDTLALELYLKCLHAIDHNGDAGWGHDPWALFTKLKPGTQKSVHVFYTEQLKTHPAVNLVNKNEPNIRPTIELCLQGKENFFQDIRYFFEGRKRGGPSFFWPLTRIAVRNTILAINPNWKN